MKRTAKIEATRIVGFLPSRTRCAMTVFYFPDSSLSLPLSQAVILTGVALARVNPDNIDRLGLGGGR